MMAETQPTIFMPTWLEINAELSDGTPLNPLEKFIYDHEPYGHDEYKWRDQLRQVIEWVRAS